MELTKLVEGLPSVSATRPYFNHAVEFKRPTTTEERARMLESVGLNVFMFPAELVSGCDLLSDSGTTTMTNKQWASLHEGDVSYGSNRGYYLLARQVRETFGPEFFTEHAAPPNAFLFHQGRPAESALFTAIGRLGRNLTIPSNGHFDTTQANIEANGMRALSLFSPDLNGGSDSRFKGDMDVDALKKLLQASAANVPLVFITITNNTGWGQPVSMQNMREAAELAHHHGIPLFFDACRFAENAWFIKQHESGYGKKSISEIVREMFSHADGFTISFKKDGLANMGGGLFLRRNGLFFKKYPAVPDELIGSQILKEGNPTYGGISGRDIMTIVEGLKTATREEYLAHRIGQVRQFGERMLGEKLPVVTPFGGHAVYLDVNKFFDGTKMRPDDFGGISLTALLLAAYGHRACELGYFAFGKHDPKTGKESFPPNNFVRFAVPRLRYEQQDLESVSEAVKALHESRDKIPPVKATYGRDLPLRHFKARFEFAAR
ncbi:tryptophanase [Candidatus Micrarchaeota archaeon]|nr:tryptophanase [Candidatus Micrarchaeota archaeon]